MSDNVNVIILAELRRRRHRDAEREALETAAALMAEAVRSAGPAATRRAATALLRHLGG
jgi:signal transduction protein with GAF and PtsI domain